MEDLLELCTKMPGVYHTWEGGEVYVDTNSLFYMAHHLEDEYGFGIEEVVIESDRVLLKTKIF